MKRLSPSLNNAWFVALIFTATAIVTTWPLTQGIRTEIAGDLGDPALNCWIMMWTGGQILRFLKGDLTALADFWNGNIFYPERNTIAFSEHLTPQMLQALPVFAVTGNIVLAYNLIFLSTIVLSGLGMYLFVRELTGRPLAAIVAGAAFAFSPYRSYQAPHLQVISTQWMPLVFYGLHRYAVNGGWRPLIGGASALVLQMLSCGYYIFYFTPFAALYGMYELVVHGRWRDRRTWTQILLVGVGAAIVLAPFVVPYLRVRETPGFGVRERGEVASFSADTWAFATAYENLALFGPKLQTYVKGESKTFPGFTILLLAIAGGLAVIVDAARQRQRVPRAWWRTVAAVLLGVISVAAVAAWAWMLIGAGGVAYFGSLRVSVHDLRMLEWQSVALFFAAVLFLPGVRRTLGGSARVVGGFMIFGAITSLLMTLGPEVRVHGKVIGTGLYQLFYVYVPGFNGMRVPARFFMVTTFFFSVLAGLAIAAAEQRWRRAGVFIATAAACLIVAEGFVQPFVTNARLFVEHFDLTPRHLASADTLGPVYDRVRDLPSGAVLAEIPYGAAPYDALSVFYAGFHRKPLLNGYSGFFPKSFNDRLATLAWDPTEDRDAAWRTLITSGATHVVVHEAAYFDEKGAGISKWLRTAGATELATNGTDRLFALK